MANIAFDDEYTKLRAVVRPASHKGELRRLDMQEAAASKTYADAKEMGEAVWLYPRLICATPAGELTLGEEAVEWPPTFEQYLEISDPAVDVWYLEVKRLNPNWFPSEEQLKKMMETNPPAELSSS